MKGEKKMEVSLRTVMDSFPVIEELFYKDIPAKASLRIRSLKRELHDYMHDYVDEEDKLLKKHAELDENGEFVRPEILDENGENILDHNKVHILDWDKFEKEYKELLRLEVPITTSVIPFSTIKDVDISGEKLDKIIVFLDLES